MDECIHPAAHPKSRDTIRPAARPKAPKAPVAPKPPKPVLPAPPKPLPAAEPAIKTEEPPAKKPRLVEDKAPDATATEDAKKAAKGKPPRKRKPKAPPASTPDAPSPATLESKKLLAIEKTLLSVDEGIFSDVDTTPITIGVNYTDVIKNFRRLLARVVVLMTEITTVRRTLDVNIRDHSVEWVRRMLVCNQAKYPGLGKLQCAVTLRSEVCERLLNNCHYTRTSRGGKLPVYVKVPLAVIEFTKSLRSFFFVRAYDDVSPRMLNALKFARMPHQRVAENNEVFYAADSFHSKVRFLSMYFINTSRLRKNDDIENKESFDGHDLLAWLIEGRRHGTKMDAARVYTLAAEKPRLFSVNLHDVYKSGSAASENTVWHNFTHRMFIVKWTTPPPDYPAMVVPRTYHALAGSDCVSALIAALYVRYMGTEPLADCPDRPTLAVMGDQLEGMIGSIKEDGHSLNFNVRDVVDAVRPLFRVRYTHMTTHNTWELFCTTVTRVAANTPRIKVTPHSYPKTDVVARKRVAVTMHLIFYYYQLPFWFAACEGGMDVCVNGRHSYIRNEPERTRVINIQYMVSMARYQAMYAAMSPQKITAFDTLVALARGHIDPIKVTFPHTKNNHRNANFRPFTWVNHWRTYIFGNATAEPWFVVWRDRTLGAYEALASTCSTESFSLCKLCKSAVHWPVPHHIVRWGVPSTSDVPLNTEYIDTSTAPGSAAYMAQLQQERTTPAWLEAYLQWRAVADLRANHPWIIWDELPLEPEARMLKAHDIGYCDPPWIHDVGPAAHTNHTGYLSESDSN
jgi:hypothetical protein